TLIGELRYLYGNYVIDPFSHKKKDVVIMRDTIREREIMSLIEQAHFHYNGKELYLNCKMENVLYNFLYTILPLLEEKVDLYLTNDIRRLMVEEPLTPEINVKVETNTNLLEVGFSIDGVSDKEVNNILQADTEKKRYYRM